MAYGWVLTERLAEFDRHPDRPIKIGKFDSEIRALMASSEAPLCAPEIAKQLLPQLPPNVRGQKKRTLRSVQNRVMAFLREQRRFGKLRPVRVEGKKAQCWEFAGDGGVVGGAGLINNESEPTEGLAPADVQSDEACPTA
jgi:hypothetical protein